MEIKTILQAQDLKSTPKVGIETIRKNASIVLQGIKTKGKNAMLHYTKQLCGLEMSDFEVRQAEFERAEASLSPAAKQWLVQSIFEVQKFYGWPRESRHKIETSPGVLAWQSVSFPQSVGIYVEDEGFADLGGFLNLAVLAQICGIEALACCPPDSRAQANPYLAFLAYKLGIRLFKAPAAVGIAAMSLGTAQLPKVEKIFGRAGEYAFQTAQLLEQAGVRRFGLQPLLILCDQQTELEKLAIDVRLYQKTFPEAKIGVCFLQEAMAQKFAALLRAKVLWGKRKDPSGDFPNLLLTQQPSIESFLELVKNTIDAQVVLCLQDPTALFDKLPTALHPYYHSSFLLNGSFTISDMTTTKVCVSNRSLSDYSNILHDELFDNKLEADLDVAP